MAMFISRARTLVVAFLLAIAAAPAVAQQVYEDLIIAVANDRADEVKRLLARGMDANSVDPNGDPLLFIAARAGYRATVDTLLAAKASVNAKNRFGDTPLMAAALNGHLEIVRKLRAQGADIEPRGWTPLIYGRARRRRRLLAGSRRQRQRAVAERYDSADDDGPRRARVDVRPADAPRRRHSASQRERRVGARLGQARE